MRARPRPAPLGAALALTVALAVVLTGCGAAAAPKPAAERLRREDLVAVARALAGPEPAVSTEVAATKAAWPQIANGLPDDPSSLARAPIEHAAAAAAQIALPAQLQESQAATLTGPASALAGLFRAYGGLATRGWQLIGSSLQEIEHGTPAAAAFARANSALYIESVYDGHFDLAQIGKKLPSDYAKLGGPAAFGQALTQAEVDALAQAYSEQSVRLHPHPGVRLGS